MANSRRISQFTGSDFDLNDDLTFVANGQNFKGTVKDLLDLAGAIGTLDSLGEDSATPVLVQPSAKQNLIRKMLGSRGIVTGVSPLNGVSVAMNAAQGDKGVQIIENLLADQYKFRTIDAGEGIAIGVVDDSIVISGIVAGGGTNIIIVNDPSDFPTPVAGVITLEDNTTYIISSQVVDISPNRIVCGVNSVIRGNSVLNNTLRSTTTGDFITSTTSIEINDLLLDFPNGRVFKFDSPTPKTGIILIDRAFIKDCQTVAFFKNYDSLLINNSQVNGAVAGGLEFRGANKYTSIRTLVFESNGVIFDLKDSTHKIAEVDTVTIIPILPTTIVLDGLQNSGNIEPGGVGTVRAVNVLQPFTDSPNIEPSDIRWNFYISNVLQDSVNQAYIAMPTNPTETEIVSNTPIKVAGTFTDVSASRFTNDATGRATYIGERLNIPAIVNCSFSFEKLTSGTNSYTFQLAKNGVLIPEAVAEVSTDPSRNPNINIAAIVDFSQNDFIELWVTGNSTNDNVRVFSYGLIVNG